MIKADGVHWDRLVTILKRDFRRVDNPEVLRRCLRMPLRVVPTRSPSASALSPRAGALLDALAPVGGGRDRGRRDKRCAPRARQSPSRVGRPLAARPAADKVRFLVGLFFVSSIG